MRTFFRASGSGLLLLAAALFTLTLNDAPASATSFVPTGDFEVSDTAAGAHADVTIEYTFEAPDALFSGAISFLPPEWGIGSCPANDVASATTACAGESMPVGQLMAENTSNAVLGVLGGVCSTQVPLIFDLMNATLETGDTVVFHDTDDNGVGQMFEDLNENDIPDGAELWPEFITRLIRTEPFPGGDAIEPLLRMYGQFNLSGSLVGLQYVVLEPGTPINGVPMDPGLGFPVVLLLQDTGDPGATNQPSGLTDFCSPLESSLTIFGTSPGHIVPVVVGGAPIVLTNPTDGGYNLVSFLASEYDDDGDSIPNTLDPCPTQGTSGGWDPRAAGTAGDADGDGLPDICDPDDATFNNDEDGDVWLNRGDNCPTVVNANQSDLDRDGIGDLCDATPTEPSLHQHFICLVEEVEIGAGGDPAGNPFVAPPCVLMIVNGMERGNVDCSENGVDAVDALHLLRFDAGLWPAPPCIDAGDTNCDGVKNTIDTLMALRFAADLDVTQQVPCTPIGEVIPIIT